MNLPDYPCCSLVKNIALVSDAGTPLISEPGIPGGKSAPHGRPGIEVVCIPGRVRGGRRPVRGCGAGEGRFVFWGFLDAKSNVRKKQLAKR